MGGECARCRADPGTGRWCATCGLDSTPGIATLPTAEALEAGDRERAWLAGNPDVAAAEEAERDRAEEARRQEDRERASATQPAAFGGYRDLAWRPRLARAWLLVAVLLTVITAVIEISHLSLLARTSPDDYLLSGQVDDSTARLALAYIVDLCAFVLSAVFFIVWMHRAYKNVGPLGAQSPRYGSGWAIGGCFVPVLNLWRPKQIMNDIWRTSDPDDPAVLQAGTWHERGVPLLITAWWTLYLVSGGIDRVGARQSTASLEGDRTATAWGLAGSLATVAAGVLAIVVIGRISKRQRLRAEMLSALPARAPTPRVLPPPPPPPPPPVGAQAV